MRPVPSPLNGWSAPAAQAVRILARGLTTARLTATTAAEDLVRSRPDDPLAERDPDYIRATLETNELLSRLYFRPKVRGLEHIPAEGPVLLVGNHSGGTLIADTFAFSYAFYSYFGAERRFYQLAHDLAVRLPGISSLLRRYGTLSASHENAEKALEQGAAVLVYPGGDWESYRPSWHSDEIELAGRTGFVRLALSRDVPIVPVVAVGGQETALFLTRGERAAKVLGLDRWRLKVLPVQFAPPWGFTVLDLPGRVPLPSQITIEVLPKIDLRDRFGPEPDEEEVYDGLVEEMQQALDALADERDLPVLGKLGRRSGRGPVPDVATHEPWLGYDNMTVKEIADRLRGEPEDTLAAVRRHESAHRRRKGVLRATESRSTA